MQKSLLKAISNSSDIAEVEELSDTMTTNSFDDFWLNKWWSLIILKFFGELWCMANNLACIYLIAIHIMCDLEK